MSRTNQFIVHSPFQLYMADHMVRNMPEFEGEDNRLLTEMVLSNQDSISNRWNKHENIDPPLGPSVLSNVHRLRSVVGNLVMGLSSETEARLFLANLQRPLNNSMFGMIRGKSNLEHVVHCCFPEGIGSLRLHYLTASERLRARIKVLLGYMGGVPYHSYNSDMMGLTAAKVVYSLMPSVVRPLTTAEVVEIPRPIPIKSESDSDTCVFLGQHNMSMPNPDALALAEQAANFVLGLGFARRLYKPHHYDTVGQEREVFVKRGFEPLDDARPIEQIFMKRQTCCVVSYNSSALVQLKVLFGETLRSVSVGAKTVHQYSGRPESELVSLLDLFREVGVEIADERTRTLPAKD